MTNMRKVPLLRFPGFEGEWIKRKLGDISILERGRFSPRPRNNPKYYGGNIPFVQTGDVTNSNGRISAYSQTLNEEGLKVSKLFPKGTILITIAANIGFCAILEVDMACPDSLIGIRCKNDIHNDFLNFFLRNQQKQIDYIAPQGAQRNINIEFLKPFPVTLPTLPEQQKIAAFLSAVDARIQQLTRKKALLEQYKKGVMQRIFSRELRFRDEEGKEFPEWEVKRLGEVASRVLEKNGGSKVTYVLTNSATQGIVSQQDYFDKDIANQENLEGYYVVQIDDFIYNPRISNAAPVGPIKRNKLAQGVMSPLYTVFRFKSSNLTFLEFYFETTLWHKYMKGIANYGARHDRMNITNSDFLRLPVPLPTLPEQEKIASFLSAIDDKISRVGEQIERTQAYKKGLLQQMFV